MRFCRAAERPPPWRNRFAGGCGCASTIRSRACFASRRSRHARAVQPPRAPGEVEVPPAGCTCWSCASNSDGSSRAMTCLRTMEPVGASHWMLPDTAADLDRCHCPRVPVARRSTMSRVIGTVLTRFQLAAGMQALAPAPTTTSMRTTMIARFMTRLRSSRLGRCAPPTSIVSCYGRSQRRLRLRPSPSLA